MITDRIKALFQFIEYLHININNFTQFEPAIIELDVLRKERNKLKPYINFTDRVKENELQLKINDKIDIIEKGTIEPIQTKAKELNICDLNKTETIWNWNISDIEKLKRNFNEKDVPIIIRYKNKYVEFRKKVNLYLEEIFFIRLDETLRVLFDYFNETEESEFDSFNAKPIQVKNFDEAVDLFKQGYNSVTLPADFLLNHPNTQQPNIESLNPQPIAEQRTKLSINQIALKYVYEGMQITRQNCNEIVRQYGYTSGEKLFQRYTYYLSKTNRKGEPAFCTPLKLKNKIELIESVIEMLPKNKQEQAKDEVGILKNNYETNYI